MSVRSAHAPARRGAALSVLVAAALLAAGSAALAGHVDRFEGDDRYHTASLIARDAHDSASRALLAVSEPAGDGAPDYADALAGGYLAGRLGAPLLLTGADDVPGATRQALSDLGVQQVTLLGGTGAIGPDVRSELEAAGYQVDRVRGDDRIETAVAAAREGGGGSTVIVTHGFAFPDGLAISGVAHAEGYPVLLTASDELSPATAAYLREADPDRVLVPGGTGAVSGQVVDAIADAASADVRRLAGDPDDPETSGRAGTAAAIADYAADELGWGLATVNVVNGYGPADALAMSQVAGTTRTVTLLTRSCAASPGTVAFLEQRRAAVEHLRVAGGEGAVCMGVTHDYLDAAS